MGVKNEEWTSTKERLNLGTRALAKAEEALISAKQCVVLFEEAHRQASAGKPLDVSHADIRRMKVQMHHVVERFAELKERYDEA